MSQSDSNASSPRIADDESWKRGSKGAKGEDALGYFGTEKAADEKEPAIRNERTSLGSPFQGDEKLASSVGNGKSAEGKARSAKDGKTTPGSPVHASEETPELLLVLQEVRRKREAAERKQWLEKWEGFADSLGSNIDLSPGTAKKKSGEESRKELGKAKSSNWLLERPKAATRLPSDQRSELSERQKAMNRLPIEEVESPFDKGKSSVSLPLNGEESPLYRKRPDSKATVGEPKGWQNYAEEEEVTHRGKRNYTPTERQAALSRLPIEERKKLSRSSDHALQSDERMTFDLEGTKAFLAEADAMVRANAKAKAEAKARNVTPTHEGDAPSTFYFSPRTLRTYVTLSPPTKSKFELSPVPKRSMRPSNKIQLTPGPRSSSRSFSDALQLPAAKTSSPNLRASKSRSLVTSPDSHRGIPQLVVPEGMAGDAEAEEVVARWQTIRQTLWYDSDEEDGSYAERMRLSALRSIAGSGTAMV